MHYNDLTGKSKEELMSIKDYINELEKKFYSSVGIPLRYFGGLQSGIYGYKTMAEGYRCMMKFEDFKVAMIFFESGTDNIVIQVPKPDCVPIVKRMIIAYRGEPSMTTQRLVFYSKRFIKVVSVLDETDTRGYKTESIFYVGYADESELPQYEKGNYPAL